MLGQVQIPNCVLCSFGANDKAHGTMEAFTWHNHRAKHHKDFHEICIYNQLWLWKNLWMSVPGLSLLARLSPRQELAPSPRLPNNSLSSPPPRARSRPKRTVGDWAMLMPPWLRGGMVVSTIEITDGLKTSSTHPPPVLDVHNSALPSTSLDLCPKTCAPKILDLLRCLKM